MKVMVMSTEDFDVGVAPTSEGQLDNLRDLITEAISLSDQIAQMEEDLKAAKAALHSITTMKIPDAMASIQSDHFNFQGWEVKIKEFVSGSLPKDPERRAIAIKWLEDNGAEDLIKTQVSVEFAKSQHNRARTIYEDLRDEGLPAVLDSSVHAQTLQKFARERIGNGEQIDTELLGLFVGKVAKLKKLS